SDHIFLFLAKIGFKSGNTTYFYIILYRHVIVKKIDLTCDTIIWPSNGMLKAIRSYYGRHVRGHYEHIAKLIGYRSSGRWKIAVFRFSMPFSMPASEL